MDKPELIITARASQGEKTGYRLREGLGKSLIPPLYSGLFHWLLREEGRGQMEERDTMAT